MTDAARQSDAHWESDPEWKRLVGDLRLYREAQQQAFEAIDDALIARFVAGECTTDETERVQSAIREQPAVRELVSLLSEVVTIDHYDGPNNDAVTILRRALRFTADMPWSSSGEGCFLELDDDLVAALTQAATAPPSKRGELCETALISKDRLFAIAAGSEDREPVMGSLPWFTALSEWPDELSWESAPEISAWRVRIICRAASLKETCEVTEPKLVWPQAFSQAAPRDKDIYWEVQIGEGQSRPAGEIHLRGVFRVLSAKDVEQLHRELASTATLEDLDRREFINFVYLLEHRCFAEAIALLERINQSSAPLHLRLLRLRGLASVYQRMQRELTGSRMMGVPEGLWALKLSRENLNRAYAILNLHFPPLSNH